MKKKIFIIIILAVAAFILFRLPLDSDLGWHLKDGEKVLRQGWLPPTDTYSHTMPGYAWRSHSWGFDVLTYMVSQSMGFLPLSILFTLLPLSALVLSLKRTQARLLPELWGLCLLFSAAIVFLPLGIRSQTFTFFYSGILLYLLHRWHISRNSLWLFPIPFLVWIWVNSHGGFFIGLVIFFLYLLGEFIKRVRIKVEGQTDWAQDQHTLGFGQLKRAFIILVISTFTTFLNPYGLGIYITSVLLSTNTPTTQYILEWQALNIHSTYDSFYALYTVLLIFFLYRRKQALDLGVSLMIAAFLALMFWAIRNGPLFILISLPIFAQGLQEVVNTQMRRFIKGHPIQSTLMLVLIIAMVVVATLSPKIQSNNDNQANANKTDSQTNEPKTYSLLEVFNSPKAIGAKAGFPIDAIDWIKQNHPKGNMFNAYVWGGYLIWQLPEYPVFIDGRMPAWEKDDSEILTEHLNAEAAKPEWEKTFKKYDVAWTLLSPDAPILQVLQERSDWRQVYKDNTAIIMVKKNAP